MQSIWTRAIVLKRTPFSESDLILHLLNPQGEKVSCFARGALKSKKRFPGGVLEPTHFIEALLKPAKQADGLATIEEARLIDSFSDLRKDYENLESALFCLECVDKIATGGFSHSSSLFDLLGHTLRKLQSSKQPEFIKILFFIKVLYEQGVLEIEPWMSPLLKTKISELTDDSLLLSSISSAQKSWIQEQIKNYMKHAQL